VIRRRLPVRIRLTLWYSSTTFALATCLVISLYLSLLVLVSAQPIPHYPPGTQLFIPTGPPKGSATVILEPERPQAVLLVQAVESGMAQASIAGLATLFLLSLLAGYLFAGQALAPTRQMARVAQRISAGSLHERISFGGPQDELYHLADAFDKMVGRLERAFARERRFVQDASHELRTPLATIRLALDIALDSLDDDIERHEVLLTARAATQQLSNLVADLLALAAGSQIFQAAPTDLASLALEVCQALQPMAITCQSVLQVSAHESVVVIGSSEALRRAFTNLISNALIHNPPHNYVAVSIERNLKQAIVRVCDHGIGIPIEEQNAIFQRFYRGKSMPAHAEGVGYQGGSGLGLAIVATVVKAHRGRITVRSTPGEGSEFTLCLPLAP